MFGNCLVLVNIHLKKMLVIHEAGQTWQLFIRIKIILTCIFIVSVL